MDEHDYQLGYQAAMRRILGETMRSLNPGEMEVAKLIIERSETIEQLRQICGDHGDNEWPDELYIPDILEKHLANHLR